MFSLNYLDSVLLVFLRFLLAILFEFIFSEQDLVLRFGVHRKLDNHRGCVNTVSFNADGDTLVSGSDDRKVILWDWDAGRVKLSFDSGHSNNVFQARFMPYTGDRIIITCAADGEVYAVTLPSVSCNILDVMFLMHCFLFCMSLGKTCPNTRRWKSGYNIAGST